RPGIVAAVLAGDGAEGLERFDIRCRSGTHAFEPVAPVPGDVPAGFEGEQRAIPRRIGDGVPAAAPGLETDGATTVHEREGLIRVRAIEGETTAAPAEERPAVRPRLRIVGSRDRRLRRITT